jgi:succinate dehydrogenase hydrophobic anchor subunit
MCGTSLGLLTRVHAISLIRNSVAYAALRLMTDNDCDVARCMSSAQPMTSVTKALYPFSLLFHYSNNLQQTLSITRTFQTPHQCPPCSRHPVAWTS